MNLFLNILKKKKKDINKLELFHSLFHFYDLKILLKLLFQVETATI